MSERRAPISHVMSNEQKRPGRPTSDRTRRVAEMWAEGLTLAEIARRERTSVSAIGVVVHRLRHNYGAEMPYRRALGPSA